ncbi:hypothetical protein ACJJTC_005107 [Scirpophaga incertulas]
MQKGASSLIPYLLLLLFDLMMLCARDGFGIRESLTEITPLLVPNKRTTSHAAAKAWVLQSRARAKPARVQSPMQKCALQTAADPRADPPAPASQRGKQNTL